MREHDAAGRALHLELACLRIIDFLLIGYLRPVPPLVPSDLAGYPSARRDLLPVIIQLHGSVEPCSHKL